MNAEVVCVSSRIPTEPYYHYDVYLESLRRFAEVPTVLGERDQWRGLMTKPYLLREWLRAKKNRSDRLIVTDAWDILFAAHPHGLGDRCQEFYGDAIVFNGEKSCWPQTELAGFFPDDGSPWRFLNSGFMCGPAATILMLLECMDIESIGFDPPGGPYPNDQGEYQRLFAERPGIPMVVDSQCRIAQTLSACTLDEFDFSGERIQNKLTRTFPGVFHCNGDAKEKMLPAVREKLQL